MRVEHHIDWGQTPGTRQRFAMCSCGWRAPARKRLTHGMSDVRDHLVDIKRRCAEQGWQWSMIKPNGLVTWEPDHPVIARSDEPVTPRGRHAGRA